MPSLSPLSETSQTLGALAEGSETLTALTSSSETLTALAELTNDSSTHTGAYPATALYSAPYPFPSSTSYPGATYVTPGAGMSMTVLSEGTETLTVLSEV